MAYRFYNPYNFVRPLPQADKGDELLGRTSPPGHDRYVGITGTITCLLTSATPLFIADAEGVMLDLNKKLGHNQFEFFQLNDKPAIPASSLRGTIRSVFEAVTNSCYGVFDSKKRLSYHLDSRQAPQIVPARVEKKGDQWELRLLTGTTPLQIGQIPTGRQYAAWAHKYWPINASKTLNIPAGSSNLPQRQKEKVRHYQQRRNKNNSNGTDLGDLKHGEECFAILEDMQHPHPRIQFWDVIAVSKKKEMLKPKPGQRIEKGYLCLNNQNIEAKHSERFFFRADNNTTGPQRIELLPSVRTAYNELIADYQERHGKAIRQRHNKKQSVDKPVTNSKGVKEPGFSRFIDPEKYKELQDKDLVYAYLEGTLNAPLVKFIVPVTVPRVGYKHRIGELLPDYNTACPDIKHLCPACRAFGWVWTGDKNKPDEIAYAGRVQFSHGVLVKDNGTLPPTTLAILGNPKPTTTRFYLASKDGQDQKGLDDERVNYDAPGQVLRGRKFYYHHGEQLREREYRRVDNIQDDQNRTVKGVQKPGSQFQFTIHFENLAPLELGALLWSLEIEGWHHRLGMAKPLGFGSVKIQVTELRLLDTLARYGAGKVGWVPQITADFINLFKSAMAEKYQKPFEQLTNVTDLKALLATTPSLPVHYPRTTRQPQSEGKNFEWFMGNNKAGRNGGPRLTLKPVSADKSGLPLLDKRGQEQD